jgi:hypothetical protein
MNDSQLRTLIQSQILSGLLPRSTEQDHLFGGAGQGRPCACCGETISAGGVQFDVYCAGASLRMHLRCYDEWCKTSELQRVCA